MNSKRFKKLLAGMLTATMVMGMGITASAADAPATSGSGTGDGEFEGHVNKSVVEVTLPTASATTFAYKMDPEGLIAATEAQKYPGTTFESGANVYFLSAENTYTKDSAKLKVINKGTVDVDVTVKAKIADDTKIKMATSSTFAADNKDASLYLGLVVANEAAKAITKTDTTEASDAIVKVGLKGRDQNYEVTYTTDGGYAYAPKEGLVDANWNSFEFGLTGACNPNGDYSADALAAEDVTVTWSYAKHEASSTVTMLAENATADLDPSIADVNVLEANAAAVLNVDLGAGTLAATSVTSVKWNGTEYLGSTITWDGSAKTLTVDAASANYFYENEGAGVLNITFDNGKTISVTLARKS